MKMYKMQTIGQEHTIPVPMNGENRYIKFIKVAANDPFAYFSTDDAALQKAIESSKMFECGDIQKMGEEPAVSGKQKAVNRKKSVDETVPPNGEPLEETEDEIPIIEAEHPATEEEAIKPEDKPTLFPETEYADVTTFQQAKEILSAEPYKVAKIVISTPPKILKKAAELGVIFPNLKTVVN